MYVLRGNLGNPPHIIMYTVSFLYDMMYLSYSSVIPTHYAYM